MDGGRRKKLTAVLTFLIENKGDDLEWVVEQAKQRGVAPPDITRDKPTLLRQLEFYWSAFNDLLTDTDQLGNIRWTALDQYARRYNVQFETFRYIIRAMEKSRHDALKER